jgi:catechol 2,3-dioxygenase-like lactoylglutathione lyase family enzyme
VSVSLGSVGAITLFVEDSQESKSFYQDVFDLPVIFEDENSAVFRFENLIVNLLNISEAPGLIDPATVATREAGSRFQFSIWVDDADAVCAELATRGVELLNGPVNRAWGMRTASFTDPDGHIWEIAQQLAAAKGS